MANISRYNHNLCKENLLKGLSNLGESKDSVTRRSENHYSEKKKKLFLELCAPDFCTKGMPESSLLAGMCGICLQAFLDQMLTPASRPSG